MGLSTVAARGEDARRDAHIVFVIGEREYKTATTLREFFQTHLAPRGFRGTFVVADDEGPGRNEFTGLPEALKSADLLVLSTRRRAPRAEELKAISDYLDAGKPLVAIRTACHAFDTRGNVPQGHAEWRDFDEVVLGAKYTGHYGSEPFDVVVAEDLKEHPLLKGVNIKSSSKLYKIKTSAPTTKLLLSGRRENGDSEAVAWTNRYGKNGADVFFTSLGLETDFQSPGFRQLLLNAIHASLDLPIAVDKATPP
jgi:type 1 glutamine amidotransferase